LGMGDTERSAEKLEKERIRRENLRMAWKDDTDMSTIQSFHSEDYPAVDEIDEWFDKVFFTMEADD